MRSISDCPIKVYETVYVCGRHDDNSFEYSLTVICYTQWLHQSIGYTTFILFLTVFAILVLCFYLHCCLYAKCLFSKLASASLTVAFPGQVM